MSIKIIVIDLDGTVLNDEESLLPHSIAVIKDCKNRGYIITVATSRSEQSAVRYAKMLEADAVIFSGGAGAKIGTNLIYEELISCEGVKDCVRKCMQCSTVEYLRIDGEKIGLTSNTTVADGSIEYGHYIRVPYDKWISQRAYKITVASDNIENVKTLLGHSEYYSLLISYAGEKQHRLTAKNAKKELALESVLDYYGFTWEEVMAFGNDEADLKMIEKSGMGIAVGNAVDNIKEIADIICGSNNDQGVAEFLQEFINPNTVKKDY